MTGGCSNQGKYKGLRNNQFAGQSRDGNCSRTYPINTKSRARNALARSHFAKNPRAIRRRVFQKYPSLLKNSVFTKTGRRKK